MTLSFWVNRTTLEAITYIYRINFMQKNVYVHTLNVSEYCIRETACIVLIVEDICENRNYNIYI